MEMGMENWNKGLQHVSQIGRLPLDNQVGGTKIRYNVAGK